MHRSFIFALLFLANSTMSYGYTLNISASESGGVKEIHYENISKEYRTEILAELVADDIIKYAEKLALKNNFFEAYRVSSTIHYLNITNVRAIKKSAGYMKRIITNDSEKQKIFKDLLNEANSGLKNTNSIHRIQVDIAVALAEEARELYPKGSMEYKKANDFITKYNKLTSEKRAPNEIINKLKKRADSALNNKDYLAAINQYSTLYYASKEAYPLIKIIEILETIATP